MDANSQEDRPMIDKLRDTVARIETLVAELERKDARPECARELTNVLYTLETLCHDIRTAFEHEVFRGMGILTDL